MTSVVLGGFDAENAWRPADLAALPSAPSAPVEDSDELMAGFCEPGDVLVTGRPLPPAIERGMARLGVSFRHTTDVSTLTGRLGVRPYAVVPSVVQLANALGAPLPDLDVVARVNSKTWSNALVRDLDLPGVARVVRSTAELARADSVVVKDPYGVSGRAALHVTSPGVLRSIIRVLDRQVAAGKRVEVLVQPFLPVATDFSAHLDVAPDGTWVLLGLRGMTNRGFRHVSSGPVASALPLALDRSDYWSVLDSVAAELAKAGYHGPAGVDSAVLTTGEVVPILEVNARRSLGLLSLRLEQLAGRPCSVWQLECAVPAGATLDDLAAVLPADVQLLNGGTFSGRVYCASYGVSAESVLDTVAAAGFRPRGVTSAA